MGGCKGFGGYASTQDNLMDGNKNGHFENESKVAKYKRLDIV